MPNHEIDDDKQNKNRRRRLRRLIGSNKTKNLTKIAMKSENRR